MWRTLSGCSLLVEIDSMLKKSFISTLIVVHRWCCFKHCKNMAGELQINVWFLTSTFFITWFALVDPESKNFFKRYCRGKVRHAFMNDLSLYISYIFRHLWRLSSIICALNINCEIVTVIINQWSIHENYHSNFSNKDNIELLHALCDRCLVV